MLIPLRGVFIIALVALISSSTGAENQGTYGRFSYRIASNEVEILGFSEDGVPTPVVIPATIENLPVTLIAARAFSQHQTITAVQLPDTIRSIGEQAFDSCYNLTRINFPSSLTTIGHEAFNGCGSLDQPIYLPDAITQLGYGIFQHCRKIQSIRLPRGLDSIPPASFWGCWELTAVTLPIAVSSIDNYAFYDCVKLTEIAFPSTLTTIGTGAFRGCEKLVGISIPASVTIIGPAAFANCGIRSFDVEESNSAYSSEGGILFTRDRSTLVQFPQNTEAVHYRIPGHIRTIEFASFAGNFTLRSISFPSSLTVIPKEAFLRCVNLVNIEFAEGLTTVRDDAFFGCDGLTRIALPNGLVTLEPWSFSNCSRLKSAIVPASLPAFTPRSFASCPNLTAVCFLGNAPQPPLFFDRFPEGVTVYFLPGATGWPERFAGVNTRLWDAQINPQNPNFGFNASGFAFTVGGSVGLAVAIESRSEEPDVEWQQMTSVIIENGGSTVVDGAAFNFQSRLYRLMWP